MEEGTHPEAQVGRYLTVTKAFPHAAPWRGELRYGRRRGITMPLGMMYAFVPNEGDGWQYTLGELSVFFDRVITYWSLIVVGLPLYLHNLRRDIRTTDRQDAITAGPVESGGVS